MKTHEMCARNPEELRAWNPPAAPLEKFRVRAAGLLGSTPMNSFPHQARFEQNVELLRKLVADQGSCNVPLSKQIFDEAGTVNIGRWVGYIKTKHKQGRLDPYRIATLEAIPGWNWETRRSGPEPKQAERDNEIRSLRRQGITLEAIAFNYGLSKQRVAQLCEGVRPAKNP